MNKKQLKIENIPSILWGESSKHLFIASHGNMSHKEDDVIAIFAENAIKHGYQVLSFDLPEHGERKEDTRLCNVQNCVNDLETIMAYAKSFYKHISLFACSMGAYFSLITYSKELLEQALFLSPVVDMKRIINNMMSYFEISEEKLEKEKEIATPIGQTLYWDYYCYVKSHPIEYWKIDTAILYGSDDNLCEFNVISSFAKRFCCDLRVKEHGEHYFHTEDQLSYFEKWVNEQIYY